MDIIAGHVATSSIANDPYFHDIYYDGQSHYYIDGNVPHSGVIPVLMYDTDAKKYYQMKKSSAAPILPYKEAIQDE